MSTYTVTIGPREWELTYTYADFAEAERRTGKHLLPGSAQSIKTWTEMPPTQELVFMVFIGICKKNPLVKPEHIEENITHENYDQLIESTNAAFDRDCKAIRQRIERLKAEADKAAPLAT